MSTRRICPICGACRDSNFGPEVEVSEEEKVALRLNEAHVSRCVLHSLPFKFFASEVEFGSKLKLLKNVEVSFGGQGKIGDPV